MCFHAFKRGFLNKKIHFECAIFVSSSTFEYALDKSLIPTCFHVSNYWDVSRPLYWLLCNFDCLVIYYDQTYMFPEFVLLFRTHLIQKFETMALKAWMFSLCNHVVGCIVWRLICAYSHVVLIYGLPLFIDWQRVIMLIRIDCNKLQQEHQL